MNHCLARHIHIELLRVRCDLCCSSKTWLFVVLSLISVIVMDAKLHATLASYTYSTSKSKEKGFLLNIDL